MSRPRHVLLLSILLLFGGLTLAPEWGTAAGAEGQFLPPHADAGLDTNGNGAFDRLVINLTINVTVGGTFLVEGTLHDPSFVLFVTTSNVSALGSGVHNLSLRFFGPVISEAGVDGPFEVDLRLRDAGTFALLDGDTHTTAAYAALEFEVPPSFVGPHEDVGLDTDSNGLFDFLAVNVTVNVTSTSDFLLRGVLRRANTTLILLTSNQTLLADGIHSVSLRFRGPFLNVSGIDGPYSVDLRLFESESGVRLDTGTHTTAAYSHLDFDGPPAEFAPPHSDFGLDSDGNGLFDFLVVNASINVTDPGAFEVSGSLRNANFSLLVGTSNTTNLTSGPQTVPLWFEGDALNLSGVDGPYIVELFLRDLATSAIWDEDTHNTTAYSHLLFDGPPAAFSSPHTDFGLDTDGNGLFDYLVVNATVRVFQAGTYRLFASLQFTPLPVGFLVENRTVLGPGNHTVPLWFYGPVLGGTASEAVEVNLILHDEANATVLDSDIHPTGPHLPSDFEGPGFQEAPPATNEPTIDGTLTPGEWTDAATVNLSAVPGNELPGRLLIQNDARLLYLAYDAIGDTTEDPDDAASFSFDTGNDGVATTLLEDQFVQRGTSEDQAHYVYVFPFWVPEDAPYATNLPGHQNLTSAVGFGPSSSSSAPHRTYEFAIPLDLLGVAAEEIVALFGGSQVEPALFDASTGAFSFWPGFTTGTFPLWAYTEVLLADLTPPSLSISTPTEGSLLTDPEVRVTWSSLDGGTGIDRFEIWGDDGVFQVLPAFARSHTFSGLMDGAHSVSVRARDLAGNTRVARVEFVLDTTPPVLVVTSLLVRPFLWVTTDVVEVTWVATDAISVLDRFEIDLDGGPAVELVPWARARTFTGLAEGIHSVNISAFDVAGHRTLAVDVFAVDTIPPTVTLTAPAPDAIVTTSGPLVQWTGFDATSGVFLYELRLDDRAPVVVGGSTEAFHLAAVGDGRHVLVVTARDLAGNEASTSVGFAVDTNVFSPTGPFGLSLLVTVVVGAAVTVGIFVFFLRRTRRHPPS